MKLLLLLDIIIIVFNDHQTQIYANSYFHPLVFLIFLHIMRVMYIFMCPIFPPKTSKQP